MAHTHLHPPTRAARSARAAPSAGLTRAAPSAGLARAAPSAGFTRAAPSAGFTLVELLIVVVILGILAAVVIPQFNSSAEEARRSRFADNLRTFVSAAQIVYEKSGEHIEDGSSGVLPAELGDYVKAASWQNGTPMGGLWDSELNSFSVTSALGVHYMSGGNPGDAEWVQVDALVDDGVLTTGAFRKLASDRYYFILAE